MRMLCVCAYAEPKGYLTVAGQALTVEDMQTLFGKPAPEIKPLIDELEKWGVFSKNKAGIIYNRRMIRAEKKARTAKDNGKKGGNPTLSKQKENSPSDNLNSGNDTTKEPTNDPGSNQKPEARSHKPEEKTPPPNSTAATAQAEGSVGGGGFAEVPFLPDADTPSPVDVGLGIPDFLKRPLPGESPGNHGVEADSPPLRSRPRLADQADHSAPLPESPGKPVCEAYMAVVDEVYGDQHQVLHAGSGASAIAARWLEAGATLELIREEFETVLQTRRDKGEQPPSSLKYFDEPIARAIKQGAAPMPSGEAAWGSGPKAGGGIHHDAERNQWVGRIKGWVERRFWMSTYGPAPDKPGCACPQDVLAEFPALLSAAEAEEKTGRGV